MTKFQGQTDKVLKVQLKSALVSASWGLSAVAMGGKIPIEVVTQFVSDGSDIKITIKDMKGGVIATLNGKVYNNYHRSLFSLTKANDTGGMLFEVELSAHGLKGVASKIRVLPPVTFNDLKWLDEKGSTVTEVMIGTKAELVAKIKGPVDGTDAYITIKCKKNLDQETDIGTFPLKIKDGKISLKWTTALPGGPADTAIKMELEKLGLEYFQPLFLFEVGCFGVSLKSADIKTIAWVEFTFGPPPFPENKRKAVFIMPDGSERTETIPENGIVKIAATTAGKIIRKEVIDE